MDFIFVACAEFEMKLEVATAHAECRQLYSDLKQMEIVQKVAVAKEHLPSLMSLSCADSESRTATFFRSILKHAGFKDRNHVVIYQRLLRFWWQQNGKDRFQIDAVRNQNEHFMAVIDVCEQLSKGCSVDEANEPLATITVSLADEEKKDGHLYMALLSINTGKSGAANAALESLLRDDEGKSKVKSMHFVCSKVVGISNVVGTSRPSAFWELALIIGMSQPSACQST